MLFIHRYDSGTFWAFATDSSGVYLLGFSDANLALQYTLNVSSWPNGHVVDVVTAIFANPQTSGLVVVGSAGGAQQFVFSVTGQLGPSPAASFLGPLPCADCSDFSWDPEGEVLYAIVDEESQTSSGSMLAISTANISAPTIIYNITLEVSLGRA